MLARTLSYLFLAFVLACAVSPAKAQLPTLTPPKLEMEIVGGDLDLQILAGDFSGSSATVSDRSRRLEYLLKVKGTGTIDTKMVVETSAPGQLFGLQVVAENPTSGTPAPPVTLSDGMLPQDFLIGMLPASLFQSIDLAYTGSATLDAGSGLDIHSITYTILSQ